MTRLLKGPIFFLDDNPADLKLTERVLTNSEIPVNSFTDPQEAIQSYKLFHESGNPPQIALLDLTLSGGRSGFDVAKEIKKLDPSNSTVRVIYTGLMKDMALAIAPGYDVDAVIEKTPDGIGLVDQLELVLIERDRAKAKTRKAPHTDRPLITGFAVLFGALVLGLSGVYLLNWHLTTVSDAVQKTRQEEFEKSVNAQLQLINDNIQQRTNDKFAELDAKYRSLSGEMKVDEYDIRQLRDALVSHGQMNLQKTK